MASRTKRLIALVVVAAASAPTAGIAHDHRPPKTVLRHDRTAVQDGYLHQYCWVTEVQDGNALTECSDNVWAFPRRRVVDTGDRLVIRLRKPSPPQEFTLQAWPDRGDEITGPEGEPESLEFELVARIKKGETVAWNVVFQVEEPDRHYFIRVFGTWPDEQGGEVTQDASWLFHVRT